MACFWGCFHLILSQFTLMKLWKGGGCHKNIGANKITWVAPKCAFRITFGGIFFKKPSNFFILLFQGLCKRFQNICNFQKFWSLSISPLSVTMLNECFWELFILWIFCKLIHMFQWYIMNLTILKNLILSTLI